MVEPKTIGLSVTAPPKTPAERRREGRAVVPGQEALRTVELFNATPVLNGRAEIVTAENSTLRFLRFARIFLDAAEPGYAPQTVQLAPDEEAVFYVGRGSATLAVGEQTYEMEKGDVLYAGIGSAVRIETASRCDLSEYRAAECSASYPVQLVRHADIEGTPLAADLGRKRPSTRRTVFKLVDQNVQACRLLFGDTYMEAPGGVGSYPPHFHGPDGPHGLGENAKEEIYHFRCQSDIEGDVPYVLQNCSRPGEAVNVYVHVFDEEAINVTPSFHDTIAPPAVDFTFNWCLGAYKENHRDWSEIFNRPGYDNEW